MKSATGIPEGPADPLLHGAGAQLTAAERQEVDQTREVLSDELSRLQLLHLVYQLLPTLAGQPVERYPETDWVPGAAGAQGVRLLHQLIHVERVSLEGLLLIGATLMKGALFLYTRQRRTREEAAGDEPILAGNE